VAIQLPNGKNYYATSTGIPLVGGKVYAYVPGTSTPKDTYTTSAASVANTNPVILDSRGEAVIYWVGSYDIVLKDASDATIWGPERLEDASSNFAADLASTSDVAKGDALMGVKLAATGSVARTQHDKNSDLISALDFTGASVAAQLDAAITAAGTNVVLVPASLGAGEPTNTGNNWALLDMRGGNALGAGRKMAFNLSDANGQNLVTYLNDLHSYTLSSAAIVAISRGLSGSIPNNRNIEGLQAGAYLAGSITGGGAGFILCATENDSAISSTGGQVGFMWGASFTSTYSLAATTTIDEIAGLRAINVANNSASVTPARMYGGIFDAPTGLATKKGSAYFKGDVMANGFTGVEANLSLASAATITPTGPITVVSGTAAISTITVPSIMAGGSGQITLLPTGAWTMNTAGNIVANVTAVVGKALTMTYSSGAWYPSYF
jgi:hypothetical protein